MDNRRGVVSISTFPFIVLILMALFGLSYYSYLDMKENLYILNKETELINSMTSFRTQILDMSIVSGSTMDYKNSIDSYDIIFTINGSTIYSKMYYKDILIEEELSSLGVRFCSEYSFMSKAGVKLYFDGNCVSKII